MDAGASDDRALVVLDDSRWPLVRATWPASTSDAALELYIAYVLERLQRGERFAIVVDGRVAMGMSRSQHKRIAEELLRQRAVAGRLLVMALVIATPLARVTLRAINSLAPPPFPQRVFANTDEALRWANLELAAPAARR